MSGIKNAVQNADLRVSLLLVLVNAIAVMLCVTEICFIALLLFACLWLCLSGRVSTALKLAAGCVLLFGLSRLTLGVRGFETFWMFSNLIRHMLIPIAFTAGLADAPTGTLLTVFSKLRLPKAFGIATVVLLRFIPTIGYELRAIRGSLKFRGTGVGFWNTLTHISSNFELTIVPLLIRTTRIAEELSAAAMVRGVRINNAIVSYDMVEFRRGDALLTGAFAILVAGICLVDRLHLVGVVV